jgi:hypothetical protein
MRYIEVGKMTWKEITNLKDLTKCPLCTSEELTTQESGEKMMKECTCGCRIYETKYKIWYVLPSKEVVKQVEMEGYYDSNRS